MHTQVRRLTCGGTLELYTTVPVPRTLHRCCMDFVHKGDPTPAVACQADTYDVLDDGWFAQRLGIPLMRRRLLATASGAVLEVPSLSLHCSAHHWLLANTRA